MKKPDILKLMRIPFGNDSSFPFGTSPKLNVRWTFKIHKDVI